MIPRSCRGWASSDGARPGTRYGMKGRTDAPKDEEKLEQTEFIFAASQKYRELKAEQKETGERVFPFGKLSF